MKQKLFAIFILMILIIPSNVMADGTAAGTSITNFATAKYVVGSTTYNERSNTVTTIVAEMLDVKVVWQDGLPGVTVSPGDTAEALAFLITNTGNGTDTYNLAGLSTITSGDVFDPTYQNIYYDEGDGSYGPGDTLYTSANLLTLAAEASQLVFVLNNIPLIDRSGDALVDDDTGSSQLIVTSETISGVASPGTIFSNLGDVDSSNNPTDAIVGTTGALQSATGTYIVSTIVVSIVKSFAISNDFNTTSPIPGARITYSLVVSVTGSGTAHSVVITDAIPTNTTYIIDTIELNTFSQSDAVCTSGTPVDEISVALGSLNSLSATQTITFAVEIN